MSPRDGEPEQTVARVVWSYYVANHTQQEIADRLGLTRLRVNRIIGQARADGSVRVDLRLPLAECVALAERLLTRFGLADVAVVPGVAEYHEQQRIVGEEAGRMLDRLLEDGLAIGIGWGRTLRASLSRISPRNHARSWVVALMGGLTRGSGANTFEVASGFADALGAECWYLAAPIYCPTEESRHALLTHDGLAGVLRRAREVNLALVTCGDFSENSLLATTQTVRANETGLKAAGAVGDLLGTFLDRAGRPVGHAINRQVVALAPQELAKVPVSILAAGGLNKAPAIGAILRGGYVNRLVTDEICAKALLEDAALLEETP